MTARRGKERAAPRERPRAKKKVIRAPAVSASLGSTNLREQVRFGQDRQVLCDPTVGSAATHCGANDMDRQTK